MDTKILGPSLGISEGLLKRLNQLFPDKLPTRGTDLETLAFLQGTRYVVDKLIELSEDDFNED
jgi:hypothetical protein